MIFDGIPYLPFTILYFHFPFPVSNVQWAGGDEEEEKEVGQVENEDYYVCKLPNCGVVIPVRDLRGEIEDPQSLHVALPVGTRLQSPA